MNTWPIGLQQLLNVDSFQKKYGSTTIRSDMDTGPAKVRSRYTDAVDIYTCTILMSYDEESILAAFFKTTLGNGSLPFEFVDPFSGDTYNFRFLEPPVIAPVGSGGITYRVSMNWERLP